MPYEYLIRGLPLLKERGYYAVYLMKPADGKMDTGSGTGQKLAVFPVSK